MIPDLYTHEKLVIQHRQQLFREAEHERMLAMTGAPKRASHVLQRFASKLGMFLVVLGTKLKQFEQPADAVTYHSKV